MCVCGSRDRRRFLPMFVSMSITDTCNCISRKDELLPETILALETCVGFCWCASETNNKPIHNALLKDRSNAHWIARVLQASYLTLHGCTKINTNPNPSHQMSPSLQCSGKTMHQICKSDQTQASVHHYNVRTSHSNWHRARWKGFARSAQLAWFNVAQVQLVQQKWQDTCSIDLHRMYRWMVVISSILPGVSNIWSSATQTIDPCRACTVVPGDGLRHKRQRLFSDDVQWISWYLPTVSGIVRLGTTGIVIRR